jgi:hypothetical protein
MELGTQSVVIRPMRRRGSETLRQVQRLRDQAEEVRTVADGMHYPAARDTMLRLALDT